MNKLFKMVKDEIENQATIKDINDELFNTMLYLTYDIKLDFINLDNRDLWIEEHQEKIIDFVSVNNLIEKEKNKYTDDYGFDFLEDLNEFSYEIAKALFYLNENNESEFIKQNILDDNFEYTTISIKHGHMQTIHDFDDFDEAHQYACEEDIYGRRLQGFTIEINNNDYDIEKDEEAFLFLNEHFWG